MAPKKQAVYFFALECREKRGLKGSMKDVIEAVYPEWQAMTPSQRAPYERMAVENRELEKMPRSTSTVSQSFTFATDDVQEKRDTFRRKIERLLQSEENSERSESEILANQRWYIIKFVTFCRCDSPQENYNPYYVLGEVGVVEYSLSEGITGEYQAFITPNKIPVGYRSRCMDSQRDVHKIPLEVAKSSELVKGRSYARIYEDIYDFVNQSSDNFDGIFCMSDDLEETQFGLKYLHDEAISSGARLPELHHRVLDLQSLVIKLYSKQDKINNSTSTEILTRYSYDYSSGTRCDYHDEEGVIECAIGIVKRKAYLISDHLLPIYDIQVTPNHLPVEDPHTTPMDDDAIEFRAKFRQAARGDYRRKRYLERNDSDASLSSHARSGYEPPEDIRYTKPKIDPTSYMPQDTRASSWRSRVPVSEKLETMSQVTSSRVTDDVCVDWDDAGSVATCQSQSQISTSQGPEVWYPVKTALNAPPLTGSWSKPMGSKPGKPDDDSRSVLSEMSSTTTVSGSNIDNSKFKSMGRGRGRVIGRLV